MPGQHVTGAAVRVTVPARAKCSVRLTSQTITKVKSTAAPGRGRLLAVNQAFIAYRVGGDKIRVMLRSDSTARMLLRGHDGAVVDMGFASATANLLASVDDAGCLKIWSLAVADGSVHAEELASVTAPDPGTLRVKCVCARDEALLFGTVSPEV